MHDAKTTLDSDSSLGAIKQLDIWQCRNGKQFRRVLERRFDAILGEIVSRHPDAVHEVPYARWLLDNSHIVRQALQQIQTGLPTSYLRQLAARTISDDPTRSRIFSLIEQATDRYGLPIDCGAISSHLRDYDSTQAKSPQNDFLTLGELWAVPIALRIVLLQRLYEAVEHCERASESESDDSHVSELTTVAGCVSSLRTVETADWNDFVEQSSAVERLLRDDPPGVYRHLDFSTRDYYRRAVEEISRHASSQQYEVAEAALRLSEAADQSLDEPYRRHIGYYLIDEGRSILQSKVGYRPGLRDRLKHILWRRRTGLYLFFVIAPAMFGSLALLSALLATGTGPVASTGAALLALIPLLSVTSGAINLLVTNLIAPCRLPKMDFSEGIPDDNLTMVVVPMLLSGQDDIADVLANLEQNYLANSDRQLRFALLSDFCDAASRELPGDKALLKSVLAGIDALNDRYEQDGLRPFHVFHRRRLWNESSGLWMGWERKRGKLEEFNELLRGASGTSYELLHGDELRLSDIRYVITLDADSYMPPGAAARLVGTIAHPLNKARYDATGQRVVKGHTIIQPRLETNPVTGSVTRFTRIFAGDTTLDLYTNAVSDVYQDLFGDAVFVGKGIYDVDTFSRSVTKQIEPNTILSHDLLEGLLGRVGLASDIVVLEDYPSNYRVYLKRLHRWIRGDWQLIPWLFRRKTSKSRFRPGIIGRWKVFDNLRRSLVTPALLLMLLGVWLWFPGNPIAWTLIFALFPGLPILLRITMALRTSSWRWGTIESSLRNLASHAGADAARWFLALVFLPAEAYAVVDATVRTLFRLTISRRRLLEWSTAAHVAKSLGGHSQAGRNWRDLWAGPATGLSAAIAISVFNPVALPAALPLILIWLFSPVFALRLGRPRLEEPPVQLAASDQALLRGVARDTWRFFEQYVGADTCWLPPDNVQDFPSHTTAERTSPTNIGMMLLSTLAAYDLGYLGARQFLTRLTKHLTSIRRMKKHRGHLLNWYSTRNLRPLEPRYVSTVDSGNFVAALIVVREALADLPSRAFSSDRVVPGLEDELDAIRRHLLDNGSVSEDNAFDELRSALNDARQSLATGADLLSTVNELQDRHCSAIEASFLNAVDHTPNRWSAEDIARFREDIAILRQRLRRLIADRDDSSPNSLEESIEAVSRNLDALIDGTQFSFLYDRRRELFHVGYNTSTGEPDPSYYDLLASEARIASLVAIAKGDVPARHWVHLGRPLTRIRGLRILLSWSATAFEYLMPRLIMHSPPNGLLSQSCEGATQQQIRFGKKFGIPWGVSESGYARLDAQGHYQYYAFGVSRLGLKWDHEQRLVVSPYASALALPYRPAEVVQNFRRLLGVNAHGRYGLYEAADFGDARTGPTAKPEIVRAYMSHHQGMILVAIANALHGDEMVNRFHRNSRIVCVEHLLHEQLPQRLETRPIERLPAPSTQAPIARPTIAQWRVPNQAVELAVLSNGHLTCRLSNHGGGALSWHGMAATRWSPLTEGPHSGSCIFIKDVDQDRQVWSLGAEPLNDSVETYFAPHAAEFRVHRNDMLMRMTVSVAPSADVELRKVSLTNHGPQRRRMMIASYCEPVLTTDAEDKRHPAFSKLFLETQMPGERQDLLLFRRRPRESKRHPTYLAHTAVVSKGCEVSHVNVDRGALFGRNGDRSRPAAFDNEDGITGDGEFGCVEQCASIEVMLDIAPYSTAQCAFLTAVGDNRSTVLSSLEPLRSIDRVNWIVEEARLHSEQELSRMWADSDTVRAAYKLLAQVTWPRWLQHLDSDETSLSNRVQDALWRHGISGDRPIVTLRVDGEEDLQIAESLLRTLAYLSSRDCPIDVIFLDETKSGYALPIHDRLRSLVERYRPADKHGSTGFIVPVRDISTGERRALIAAARLYVDTRDVGLLARLKQADDYPTAVPAFVPQPSAPLSVEKIAPIEARNDLVLPNRLGGLLPDLNGYSLLIDRESQTPAPWCNIIANPNFGTLVSESGSMCTWWQNSSERRLTPWNNDPVLDRTGEAVYIRDEETGLFWSSTPQPRGSELPYRVTHGIGESAFEHHCQGLEQRLQIFVDSEEPVKILRTRLRNRWPRARRLTITYAVEWLLGNSNDHNGHLLIPVRDSDSGALLVRNAFVRDQGGAHAFLAASLPAHGVTTDGFEFFGQHWSAAQPAGLEAVGLSDRVTASARPCAAYQVHINLPADGETEFHFVLGAADSLDGAQALVARSIEADWPEKRFLKLKKQWNKLLGAWTVQTADDATDAMINSWLLYQIISSRLWGRMGFYQASGGFGFRDQLQDVVALLDTAPEIAREHIRLAATRQFEEGDVLHWWHEKPLRGVRTRCSDDLLWLVYAVIEYLEVTADESILNDTAPFLHGEPLRPDENERYAEYQASTSSASIYEHCCRAIDSRIAFGAHGMPFIGTGDWCDGLNRVGEKGKGESVWMAWFLIVLCRRFAPLCRTMKDESRAIHYETIAQELLERTQDTAWMGSWYLRGYYDDGSTLGAPDDDESAIDLIAQTWAIMADAEHPTARKAMQSVEDKLADPAHRLLKLLAPPFDKTTSDPGYIKSYPPGVRENGGQYTHAATWAAWAALELDDRETAYRWFEWLNPFKRIRNDADIDEYRLEPYVTPGDIYAIGNLTGRGGWSWYSGSAAWLYRFAIRQLLGLRRRGDRLTIRPRLPAGADDFDATFRYRDAVHRLHVHDPGKISNDEVFIAANTLAIEGQSIRLHDSGEHDYHIFASDAARRDWLARQYPDVATQQEI